ncbi:glucose-6-phosphate isomerase [Bacteroidetes bacterium endosymbiont of Geopemphigus sp.]|uniref:glucose-6-phosphate isomerase n=1 Tax=Bacteroidetes bacterium endosymbiont of Geopemphigus sp. TaxID=2047937 RepID=UPI000CD1A7BB|nr:glucose-6-phosphate isomerase [Bacteroidetes bacterium endosymbiont of Geopemphigus sp.]
MSLKKIDPTQTLAWQKLQIHFREIRKSSLRELFTKDPERFDRFSLRFEDIFLDYSKNLITSKTIDLLLELARETHLSEAIEKMFSGDIINKTEGRSVLHTALRNYSNQPVYVNGNDVMPQVRAVLDQMRIFSDSVLNREWKGYTDKPITDVVHIGIGGSDLGPYMVAEALKYYKTLLKMHFVSNIDGTQIAETLREISPETTLFVIASKTFTTQETMTNALTARRWFLKYASMEKHIAKHFIALSTNIDEVSSFGIDPQNMFRFWDWVGGRYSLWGAIGLSICLAVGYDNFKELLEGAHALDCHFRQAPLGKNLPVVLALLGIWYNNFFDAQTHAILPYDQYLHRFTAYIQQADMESNGKSINREGFKIEYQSGPVIWGEPGTNGQHAFYQLLHQGTKLIPCDFIAAAQPLYSLGDHHQKLLSHFFAQTRALAFGKDLTQVKTELRSHGKNPGEIAFLSSFKVFNGSRPSNSIIFKKLTPKTLGSLIAMYEHKIFVQGVLWNLYSFDQWGVELGKELAQEIFPCLNSGALSKDFDSSTKGLLNEYAKMAQGNSLEIN